MSKNKKDSVIKSNAKTINILKVNNFAEAMNELFKEAISRVDDKELISVISSKQKQITQALNGSGVNFADHNVTDYIINSVIIGNSSNYLNDVINLKGDTELNKDRAYKFNQKTMEDFNNEIKDSIKNMPKNLNAETTEMANYLTGVTSNCKQNISQIANVYDVSKSIDEFCKKEQLNSKQQKEWVAGLVKGALDSFVKQSASEDRLNPRKMLNEREINGIVNNSVEFIKDPKIQASLKNDNAKQGRLERIGKDGAKYLKQNVGTLKDQFMFKLAQQKASVKYNLGALSHGDTVEEITAIKKVVKNKIKKMAKKAVKGIKSLVEKAKENAKQSHVDKVVSKDAKKAKQKGMQK